MEWPGCSRERDAQGRLHHYLDFGSEQIVEVRDWLRTGYLVPGRDGLGLWPDGRVVGTSPSPPPPSPSPLPPPATPRDINIGANMDRTIQYFQDRTELAKIVVQIRTIYPKFNENSKNQKLIPKLDMTLFKKIQKSKINSEAWYNFIQKHPKIQN